MIMTNINSSTAARGCRGMTLVELMVAMAIGSIVLAIVMTFTVFGGRSFVALGNYSVLDQQSRLGVDQMTREIRQATALISTNASPKSMVITNATKGISVTYVWDSATKELTAKYSNEGAKRVLLKGCEDWNFKLWQRTPYPNQTNVFYAANSPKLCKLVDMTWKCSRSVNGTKLLNTESIQTAQIVLRNQKSN
jgi:prepilin-type N-terminal cleavage/methylation domain-containing protein